MIQSKLKLVKRNRETGFTIVEMIVVLSITAILSIYAMSVLKQESEETIAKAGGNYISAVANAAQMHVLINYDAYANTTPVAGVASLLQPTVPELVGLGRLPAGYNNNFMATRQSLRVDIAQANCPGVACLITILACTTTPVTLGGPITRFDLASTMVSTQTGTGGQSLAGNGALIRGPLFSPGIPNPMGNVEGIVCGTSSIDASIYQMFVRIRDTRDPELQGDLSVEGKVNAKTKLDVGTCINMDGTAAGGGRAGFGCTDRDDLPAGFAGGVRSADVVGNGNILASSNPSGFTGTNTNYALLTTDNGAGSAEIRTSGRSAGDRLTPLGAYAPATACPASDEGSIAKNSLAVGLVTCESGFWVAMKKTGVVGQPCSPPGAIGTSAGGLALYCENGFWTLFADRFGRYAVTDTYQVYDHSRGLNPQIPIPACPAGGLPKVYFNPQSIDNSTASRTANFRADTTTSPGFYTIHVDNTVNPNDPYGTPTAGYGLLTVGCFYN